MVLLPFGPELDHAGQMISPKNVGIISDGKIHRGTKIAGAPLDEEAVSPPLNDCRQWGAS